jgi:HlyD family secretion protein
MLIKQLICTVFFSVGLTGCINKGDSQAFGTLELDRIILQAKAVGEIIEVCVSEGSMVKKGQILLRLDDSRQQELVYRAKAEAKQALAYLEQLRNGARKEDIKAAIAEVEAITAKLTNAAKEVERAAILAKNNSIKRANLDTAISIRDTLAANQKYAQENLNKLKNGVRYEEIMQAESAYEKYCANLAVENNKLEDYIVKATRNGRVDSLPKYCGEQVQLGSTVAILLVDGNPYARIYVPESMRAKISIGSKLTVFIDNIEKSYQGVVRSLAIDPAFTPYYALNQKERSRLVYLAEVQLKDATGLPIGLPVQVTLP